MEHVGWILPYQSQFFHYKPIEGRKIKINYTHIFQLLTLIHTFNWCQWGYSISQKCFMKVHILKIWLASVNMRKQRSFRSSKNIISMSLVDTGQFLLLSIYYLSSVLNTYLGKKKIIIKFLLKMATALSKILHDLFLTFSKVQAFFSIREMNIDFNLNTLQKNCWLALSLCNLFTLK